MWEWAGCVVISLLSVMWLYAKTISADETRTVFGVSHMSLLCKAAYLLRWSMPQVDRARFLLYKSGSDEGISVHESALSHTRRRRSSNKTTDRAKTLVVAFSGGAVNKIGIPRHEFRRTLLASAVVTSACDQLYVLDPTGMSMYAHELATFEQRLRDLIGGYARCVFIGNCMGATGALRFAHLLPSASSTVIAVNPEIAPAQDMRSIFRVAAVVQPRICRTLPAVLQDSIDRSSGRIRVHSSSWDPERAQCNVLRYGTEVNVSNPDSTGCAAALHGCCNERVVKLVYSTCRAHGMLGNVLRPSGGLVAIIEEAVLFRANSVSS